MFGGAEECIQDIGEEPGGNKPLRKPEYMWVDIIKIDLGGTASCGMDWIDLAYGRNRWRALVSNLTKLRVPKKVGIS
jgi:hypothetical protein